MIIATHQPHSKVLLRFSNATVINIFKYIKRISLFVCIILLLAFALPVVAAVQDDIDQRNHQIQELERQIEIYQKEISTNGSKAKTLSGEITKMNATIGKLQLEIKSLALAIDQTGTEINTTKAQVLDLQQKLELHKAALSKYLQTLNTIDRQNLTEILFANQQLSGFFNRLKQLEDTQNNLQRIIAEMKQVKTDLEDKQLNLQEKKNELEQLKKFQLSQKSNLELNKTQKNQLLAETKGNEQKYQQLTAKARQDIAAIRQQVGDLLKQGLTVEDAIKYGVIAAARLGIRPAFLIALLDVESGLGRNVGTGNWIDDMYNCYKRLGKPARAEAEKNAFMQVINKLGLVAESVKVSREPNYGCGGAIGPAQFLPSTWLGYEAETAKLTGHNPPNPWNIEDAFTASAIKLSRAGATDKNTAGETRAAKAYISGNSSCTSRICNYYANTILNKAAIIERNL